MAYILSGIGENRAMRVAVSKNSEDAVLSFMYMTKSDPVEIEEILDETHMDDATARKVMGRLVTKGYVKEV